MKRKSLRHKRAAQARAEQLTASERSSIASKAGSERWGKLTAKKAVAISTSKSTAEKLAKRYRISVAMVGKIRRGETWASATGIKYQPVYGTNERRRQFGKAV